MEERLNQVFLDVLGVNAAQMSDDISPDSIDTWDSMNNLRLITAIEKEFNIELTMDEIEQMLDVGSIKSVLSQKA